MYTPNAAAGTPGFGQSEKRWSGPDSRALRLTSSDGSTATDIGSCSFWFDAGFIGPGRMWETQVARQAAAGSQYYATDPETVGAQMTGMVPMRRYGSVQEVATVVAFLLSEDASYVTGVNVEVSGGSV